MASILSSISRAGSLVLFPSEYLRLARWSVGGSNSKAVTDFFLPRSQNAIFSGERRGQHGRWSQIPAAANRPSFYEHARLQHGPLILCDLASVLRKGGLSRIFPRTPGESAQPRVDCGVLLGTHLFKQHTHSENSEAAARLHVEHFAVQFACAHAIADAET